MAGPDQVGAFGMTAKRTPGRKSPTRNFGAWGTQRTVRCLVGLISWAGRIGW